ncbi:hypothetical protein HBI56_192440 [Parastagonospora nodorum]|nr:hypothetical protein HBH56_177890 [Parastagonospora nodorum]KAH3931960.1 hypothetical protein HBH54_091920 [Parastagonospora nodorum]KAH3964355.1 hypothetical protein HBH52_211800 [Parastagonospora nodorum]KAH4043961.1 hypothetical protein HBH49_223520 [Parastagonospora nodorum]KAH4094492.1 hypothetical protein HBH46_173400 [Parastagonospora nodorum]
MTVAPDTKCLVTCSSDIKLALDQSPNLPIHVSAAIPTTITTTSRTVVEAGWRALPEELRLRVLHFNLLNEKRFVDCLPPSRAGQKKHENQLTLFKFFSVGPEIASSAPEAYYKANKFFIFDARRNFSPLLVLPSIRPWIARVALVVSLSHTGTCNLSRSEIFLATVEIAGFVHRHFLRVVQDPDACHIQFVCSGSLELEKDPWNFNLRDQLEKIDYTMEGVEERLRKAIHFTT